MEVQINEDNVVDHPGSELEMYDVMIFLYSVNEAIPLSNVVGVAANNRPRGRRE